MPVILENLSKDALSLCRGSSCVIARGLRVDKQLKSARSTEVRCRAGLVAIRAELVWEIYVRVTHVVQGINVARRSALQTISADTLGMHQSPSRLTNSVVDTAAKSNTDSEDQMTSISITCKHMIKAVYEIATCC